MGLEEVRIRNRDHKAHRAGWLRAGVLGVNDGLVSTASLDGRRRCRKCIL